MSTDVVQLPAARLQWPGAMALQQGFGMLVGVAAIVALLVGGWLWGQQPDYRVLYANLSDRDGGVIIAQLQQMNVPYKFAEGGGALQVPAAQVHEVRLRLASQGLPKGGLAGFELMETQKLGTTQFQEQVNYQRALEGELARSIQSLAAVGAARVHIAFSKPSVFMREQQKPSASVLVSLHPGRQLDAVQVSAIVHLVASSVPELPVKNVTVIDQGGNLLSAQAGNSSIGLDPGQLKYQHEIEQSFARRIEAILAPITGGGNVLAQVTADIDFSQSENIAEIYSPNPAASAAIRSQQTSESSGGGGAASGVPGALSNQPPGNASAPLLQASGATGSGLLAGGGSGSMRRDATVNYEVDKTIRHTRQPMGAIKRLSVAVVVNHRKLTDAQGKVASKALSADELAQINALVKEVMGFNQERGDSLNVTNSAFTMPEAAPVVELPLWKQPETIATAKEWGKNLLIAALVLFLVLGVLRPLLTRLAAPRAAPAQQQALPQQPVDAAQLASQQRRAGYEESLDAARQLARSEPKLVASVVKEWVSGNE
jgi:flagellar M-ring protein FliF